MNQPLLIRDVPRLPPRPPDANKGTFGKVVVIAGSRGMAGAAVLCAGAALRGGAGLARLATTTEVWPIASAANPCYTTVPLPHDEGGRLSGRALPAVVALVRESTAAAVGPGLGQSSELAELLVSLLEQTITPLVVDADALNNLVGRQEVLARRQGPLVLTPHPGELGRLTGRATADVQQHRQELAVEFAAAHRVILVLKGAGTVVTDGRQVYVNTSGNPGLATGGSGDVLTGLIAALLAQGLTPFAAAQLGVYVHGRAGDLAAQQLNEMGLIASDLLHYLPLALREVQGSPAGLLDPRTPPP
jgi:NAD(P)H-hydrate epimerase